MFTPAHGLQPVPRRHGVHLEHEEASVLRLDDVDAGIVGADARGGAHRKIDQLLARDRGLGARALLDIGDPARAMSDHGGDDLALAHENPPVLVMRLRRRDELLEIIDPVHLLMRRQIGERGDEAQALALCPEQRLLHQSVPFAEHACRDRRSLEGIDASEGARRRQPLALEEEGGGGLVDAALDGAGVVPHGDAELAERMQHPEIERDLLERAARHEADEGALGKAVAEPGNGKAGRGFGGEAASIERDEQGGEPALLEGLAQGSPMPIAPVAEKDDARVLCPRLGHGCQENERASTAVSIWPAW